MDRIVSLFKQSKNISALLGAGMSTSAGLPDFRSSEGVYEKLQKDYNFNLPSPEALYDINYFRKNPVPYFTFSGKKGYRAMSPTKAHSFIFMLEQLEILNLAVTQNIDGLEKRAGVTKLVELHGNTSTAS